MSVTERSSGRLYQFSAYESNETKRRMRSLHSKAWSNEETMEPQIPPENKTWRDKFAAFQQSVTCRFAAPRVTTTVAHPFFSLVLMSGSILTGLFVNMGFKRRVMPLEEPRRNRNVTVMNAHSVNVNQIIEKSTPYWTTKKMVEVAQFYISNSNSIEGPGEEEKYKEAKGKRRGKSAGREIPAVGFAPDPTAERDLDNASPATIDFCGKFKCHYCIFVYLASNEVDDELYPFFRSECAEMVKNAEICDLARCRLLRSEEVQGSLKDRRLKALEAQTQCSVKLGKLHGRRSIIKGLPRRRLTIAGPSFNHICHAVQMMEHMFPRLMQYAIFPYRFPVESDLLKFQSNRTFDHHSHEAALRLPGASSLTSQVDDHSNWRKFICPK
ncbi:hypothetical protein ECG_05913 [Echinococcus granulosus]|uniref:Expressed conserved protein n=2 Tax=Echinococcus granulosus TaxID=6210 RepID=A0A068WMJ2_ECHGR|nr:hypothetical protein ECG_05913 [Echinococcus granulosus]CDS18840.1 expressed conserved protein [Echinococcus granulosus]